MTNPTSLSRRVRAALAHRLDPGPAPPTTPRRPTRRQVREFLEAMDPATVGAPMRAAISAAFTNLWQPVRQPVQEPPEPVLGAINDQFHRLYYHVSLRTWKDTWYRGTRTYKCPTDMWIYQELIDTIRPGLVIETGTFRGGSALFIADRLHIAGRGRVISIDVDVQPNRPEHPRLTYLTGSSVDADVLAQVRDFVNPAAPVLVILDSDHSEEHVARELRAFAPLVSVGSYLIVEDTNVNGHPAAPDHGPGPHEAVQAFLSENDEFEVDLRCERYFLTQNPSGYLRRVKQPSESTSITDKTGGSGLTESGTTLPAEPDVTTPATAALDALVFDGGSPNVVLVLESFQPTSFFAGVRTAIVAAGSLARRRGSGLRVLIVQSSPGSGHADALEALRTVLREAALDDVAETLRISTPGQRDELGHTGGDVWVATYWTTAFALMTQVEAGRVASDRVVYLIQDFEPGFYPWGLLYAKASATYEAGFLPLINSDSLKAYLEDVTATRSEIAFAPVLELDRLQGAAERWRPGPDGVVRVLFYARPSKPRNMYAMGVEALRLWARDLPNGVEAVVRFAGEPLAEGVDLGPRARVEVLGKLSYEDYYDMLADTDVGLALMLSPHPGHLALEMPLAGIPTVTNDFAGYRSAWVTGLTVSANDPASVAQALLDATASARGSTRHEPNVVQGELGTTLSEAVAAIADRLA